MWGEELGPVGIPEVDWSGKEVIMRFYYGIVLYLGI